MHRAAVGRVSPSTGEARLGGGVRGRRTDLARRWAAGARRDVGSACRRHAEPGVADAAARDELVRASAAPASTGTAKPTPVAAVVAVGVDLRVTPITRPAASNSGPPELPWLIAASVWIAPGVAKQTAAGASICAAERRRRRRPRATAHLAERRRRSRRRVADLQHARASPSGAPGSGSARVDAAAPRCRRTGRSRRSSRARGRRPTRITKTGRVLLHRRGSVGGRRARDDVRRRDDVAVARRRRTRAARLRPVATPTSTSTVTTRAHARRVDRARRSSPPRPAPTARRDRPRSRRWSRRRSSRRRSRPRAERPRRERQRRARPQAATTGRARRKRARRHAGDSTSCSRKARARSACRPALETQLDRPPMRRRARLRWRGRDRCPAARRSARGRSARTAAPDRPPRCRGRCRTPRAAAVPSSSSTVTTIAMPGGCVAERVVEQRAQDLPHARRRRRARAPRSVPSRP